MRLFQEFELEKLQELISNARNSENHIAHYKLNQYMENLVDVFKSNRYGGSESSNPCCEVPMTPLKRNTDYNSAWIDT